MGSFERSGETLARSATMLWRDEKKAGGLVGRRLEEELRDQKSIRAVSVKLRGGR
jgi:hypothetical protein